MPNKQGYSDKRQPERDAFDHEPFILLVGALLRELHGPRGGLHPADQINDRIRVDASERGSDRRQVLGQDVA